MDGDMQDNPSAFGQFLSKWAEGYDVVYAIRTSREESVVMRLLFWLFYRVLNWMANLDLPMDAGCFGLMDRRVVDQLRQMPEQYVYLPGLRAWVGFRQTGVAVARRTRYDRKTRVGFRGLLALAMNSLFSFSTVPLLGFRIAGLAAIGLSIALVVYGMIMRILSGTILTPPQNLVSLVSFFAGVNLLGIALLGEYLARIYEEVKGRPRYIVSHTTEPRREDPAGQP